MGNAKSFVGGARTVSGVTLVELMIALVIGAVVVAAALQLYARGREIYRVNERIARLQEQGRVALSVIEPDIELAGYYGFTNFAAAVRFVRGSSPEVMLASAMQMRQFPARAGDALPTAVSGLPAGAHGCGVNFAVDVLMPVQGSNDAYAMGRPPTTGCNAYQNRPQPGADTLVIRRAETQASSPEANRLQLYASRLKSRTSHLLFADGSAPGVVDGDHRVQNLVVRAYYVSQDSVGQRGFPALRSKSLARSGATASFADDEVMPGIEDLQVQLAIAPADADADAGAGAGAGAGAVDAAARYVNPDFADLPRVRVLAVRVWLRVRSDQPEPAYVDSRTYRYANVVYTPAGADQHYRRVLMSRTVAVRNARAT